MTELVYHNGELYHAEDFSDEFLAHYGVKGMKWGKRTQAKRVAGIDQKYRDKSKVLDEKYKAERHALKAKLAEGKIDKATYKKKRGDIIGKYTDADNQLFEKAGKAIDASNAKRKKSIAKNKSTYKQNYKKARRANPIKTNPLLVNKRITAARANGATRTQAFANAYTNGYTKKAIYDR